MYKLDSTTVKDSKSDLCKADYVSGKHIIFVDDFVGTGADAEKGYRNLKIADWKAINSEQGFYYLSLIATQWGIERIGSKTSFEVIAGEVLGRNFQCFSENSIIYEDQAERLKAEDVFRSYGEKLCIGDPEIDGFPLGYGDCQLTIIVYDNTPDNSLPVIWYPDKNWVPLFRRNRRYHGST
jgi:hypothetical protein